VAQNIEYFSIHPNLSLILFLLSSNTNSLLFAGELEKYK